MLRAASRDPGGRDPGDDPPLRRDSADTHHRHDPGGADYDRELCALSTMARWRPLELDWISGNRAGSSDQGSGCTRPARRFHARIPRMAARFPRDPEAPPAQRIVADCCDNGAVVRADDRARTRVLRVLLCGRASAADVRGVIQSRRAGVFLPSGACDWIAAVVDAGAVSYLAHTRTQPGARVLRH